MRDVPGHKCGLELSRGDHRCVGSASKDKHKGMYYVRVGGFTFTQVSIHDRDPDSSQGFPQR